VESGILDATSTSRITLHFIRADFTTAEQSARQDGIATPLMRPAMTAGAFIGYYE